MSAEGLRMRIGRPAAAAGAAGVVTRGIALALDAVLVVVALVGGVLLAGVIVDLVRFRTLGTAHLSATDWRVAAVVAFCAYNVLGWWLFGRTVGMALLGVRVETLSGSAPPLWRSCLRMACYPLSALFLGLGFALALVTPQRRALHDLIAGTRVVRYAP